MLDDDADDQDLAETFDETHLTEDGGDIAHLDIARDVLDVTRAEDDADDDAFGDDDDFDPDTADDAELDLMLENDDGIDRPRSLVADNADRVTDRADTPADYQGGDDDGLDDDEPSASKERELDHGLEETFPASDPVSINPGAD